MTRIFNLLLKYSKIGFLVISFLVFFNCVNSRYLLDNKGTDKRFLIEQIKAISEENELSKHPILVIDGIEYVNVDEINLRKTGLQKRDIKKIELLKKEPAIRIFGDEGKRGVLLITTKVDSIQNVD
ncbi:hypothetical protein [Saccharicrinis sp. FJH54]|uniref:hypothetical protein n=1 Tax=Saccharicrinis sp. FJH54 TaxID=3344665 RepID=UPI0035D4B3DF